MEEGEWRFAGIDQGVDTLAGRTVGFDAFVDMEGRQLQHGSHPDLRPFNALELRYILRVGLCLDCHASIDDPAYHEYSQATVCPAAETLDSSSQMVLRPLSLRE